jgi:hypothetical protein
MVQWPYSNRLAWTRIPGLSLAVKFLAFDFDDIQGGRGLARVMSCITITIVVHIDMTKPCNEHNSSDSIVSDHINILKQNSTFHGAILRFVISLFPLAF